jgi:hypothetical protein
MFEILTAEEKNEIIKERLKEIRKETRKNKLLSFMWQ